MDSPEFIQDLAIVMLIAGATGWLCQRIGLSVVVGYLVAGVIVGPFTPPFKLVNDLERIQTLAQLGLVFLMFFVGLGLSLQRLRRMGIAMVAATFVGAILMFVACRITGDILRWPPEQSLYFSAMLMVSSSSIIVKVLEETHSTHHRAGQLATGVTVLEDVVAVVMLTMLASVARFDDTESTPIANVLGILTAFVTLAVIAGLLLVPRFLARVSKSAAPEIRTILAIGLLFGLAWTAIKAGYSSALGAFLLGVIISETPQRASLERALEGLRDMFCAIFFVAIGMLIDVNLLLQVWPQILGFTIFTIVARSIALSTGLIAAGHASKDAVRAGLCVTTIGEFSYVIAQLGVQEKVIPETFYPLAVGISLGTTFAAPFLIRNSTKIANTVTKLEPPFVRAAIDQYARMLESISRFSEANALWRLMRKRLIHTGVEIAVVSGILIFSEAVFATLQPAFSKPPFGHFGPLGQRTFFFLALGIVILPALIAIWRNISALTLVLAEVASTKVRGSFATQQMFQKALRTVAAVALGLWLWSLLPHRTLMATVVLFVAAFLTGITALLWRRFVKLHSSIEIKLQESLEASKPAASQILQPVADWDLNIVDVVLPEGSRHAGKTIGELEIRKEFGCSVVGIERQGFPIDYPGPDVRLYPQDKLLVLGTPDNIERTAAFLMDSTPESISDSLSEWTLETIAIPDDCPRLGSTLEELALRNETGVLIAGIQRHGKRILTPGGSETLRGRDQLLVLGTPEQLEQMRTWLSKAG